ncbi:hypothetical protein ORV05_32765 [Amycolatopsis cynarae]|uniref:Uncharacterized protein n=1 Tax=Amycolatopsis cynarae TaxID=2995223 RepID=A0ABY7B304_9PSEU|nr:hypothetical protein [Amycolatopsis sp. HUAS 11-8]WAL65602.1 hypothetical protein ORV05_32765 [Amycolatopsis sp. HUAS 11-8]
MSTPDPRRMSTQDSTPASLVRASTPPAAEVEAMTGGPTRTARSVSWLGYHLGEVAGVTVPSLLALTVSPWWATVSGLVALLWAVHEYRIHHHNRTGHKPGQEVTR